MSNINREFLIKELETFKHEENPAVQSPEFQAFVNGWNNSLEEVINWLKKQEGDIA